jgi:hypothetical protein
MLHPTAPGLDRCIRYRRPWRLRGPEAEGWRHCLRPRLVHRSLSGRASPLGLLPAHVSFAQPGSIRSDWDRSSAVNAGRDDPCLGSDSDPNQCRTLLDRGCDCACRSISWRRAGGFWYGGLGETDQGASRFSSHDGAVWSARPTFRAGHGDPIGTARLHVRQGGNASLRLGTRAPHRRRHRCVRLELRGPVWPANSLVPR